jgi:adenylate cyclase
VENEPSTASAWLLSPLGVEVPIRGTCWLGRSASNQVVLPDEKVSRQHAMIYAQGEGEFWIVDHHSSNGTYLNGRRLVKACRLADKDRIEIASHTYTFRLHRDTDASDHERTATKTIQDIRSLKCWLLVADLEDSTQFLQELPSDQAPRVTGHWLATCNQVIDDHHGAINKFLGDGFLAYWPEADNAASDVARAAKALQKLQAQAGPRFRFVVHFGKVFVGGEGSLGEESLVGTEVNFVFRMEKLASSLGTSTLLSAQASTELKSLLPATDAGHHPVPGFEGDFPFFSL